MNNNLTQAESAKKNISHLVYQGVFVGGKYLKVVPDLRQLLAHQQHGVPPGNESISYLGKRNIIYFKAFKRLRGYAIKFSGGLIQQ